ncbi:MAG: InlB B-repeat-containing protein [Bryobacteraceae bacterium]
MIRLAIVLFLHLCAAALSAQQVSSFRVSTNIPGAQFYVDGQVYQHAAHFLWPEGSKHVLSIEPIQHDNSAGRRLTFQHWRDSNGLLANAGPIQIITAHPSVREFIAELSPEYQVTIAFFNPGPEPPPGGDCVTGQAPSGPWPGMVYVNGICHVSTTTIWMAPGVLRLNAIPKNGFVFAGWSINGGPPNAYMREYVVGGASKLTAHFAPGKRIQFRTSPPGLQVIIDRAPVLTPEPDDPCVNNRPHDLCMGDFDWLPGAKHVLSAPHSQLDRTGNLWVFDKWSIGGGQNTVYEVPQVYTTEAITAHFVPGVRVTFGTSPSGLKLEIDGRDNWPGLNFEWGLGSHHTAVAPLEQRDSKGRKYVFKGWSNGGAREQEIVVDEAMLKATRHTIAEYELLGQVTVRATASGVSVNVDGEPCVTPCVIDRPGGAEVQITPAETHTVNANTRVNFAAWTDGAPKQRTWTFTQEAHTIHAAYHAAHRLTAVADPEDGASFTFEPPSADGFYNEGADVTIVAQSRDGYRFRRWGGDLAGVYHRGTITIRRPALVRALMDQLPRTGIVVVKSAAGVTPDDVVAPGSLISIFGVELSHSLEVGPANPLAQTLAGVTVRIGGRFLPLLFVSPDQVNAILPSDLPEGAHTLTVRTSTQKEISTRIDVARNAPGLLAHYENEKLYVVAFHEDGSPVTPRSPARRGEVVRLLGTGFGPYDRPVPEGFAVPAAPEYRLIDALEIRIENRVLTPEWAGAEPGYSGIASVKFRVDDRVPAGTELELLVRIHGRESNTVRLPVAPAD